jgi:hypothetical protein
LNQVRNRKNLLLKDSTRRMTRSSNADPWEATKFLILFTNNLE